MDSRIPLKIRVALVGLIVWVAWVFLEPFTGPSLPESQAVAAGEEVSLWGPYIPGTMVDSATINWKTINPCEAGETEGVGFAVGPPLLDVEISTDGAGKALVYLTSHNYRGDLLVGTEGLPVKVEPTRIKLDGSEKNRETVLSLYEHQTLEPGNYYGWITFLGTTSGNVALGVKIQASVRKETAQLTGHGEETLTRGAKGLIVVVIFLVAGLIVGAILGRKKHGKGGG
ncbi:hypothetical protein V3F56_10175 [Moorellaceae bacterium AZ2]